MTTEATVHGGRHRSPTIGATPLVAPAPPADADPVGAGPTTVPDGELPARGAPEASAAAAGDRSGRDGAESVPVVARRTRDATVTTTRSAATHTGSAAVQAVARPALRSMSRPAPSRARAAAAGAVDPPEPPRPLAPPAERPRPVPSTLMLGRLPVARIVCWQGAAAAIALGLGRALPVLVTAVVLALVVVVATVLRHEGRWAYQWVGVYLAFRTRSRSTRAPESSGDPAHLPAVVLPGSIVGTLDLDGEHVGVVEHPHGVCVLFAPDGYGAILDTGARPAPSPAVVLAALSEDAPPATAQLVVLTVAGSPQDGAGAPVHRGAWVALQLVRTVDRHTDDELAEVLGTVLPAARRRLDRQGAGLRLLDPLELGRVLAATTRLPGGSRASERWTAWHTPSEAHVSYRVTGWPSGSGGPALLERLAADTGTDTVVSLAVRPCPDDGRDLELEGVIRVCAPPGAELEDACARLLGAAGAAGADLQVGHGEHRGGAAATSPLGGFLP